MTAKPKLIPGPGSILSVLLTLQALDNSAAQDPSARSLPRPLPAHPGNIFLADEAVGVTLPGKASGWRLEDYDGHVRSTVAPTNGQATLGRLPVGFYRLRNENDPRSFSLGVLAPLRAPTPTNSPIALDVAMAWFYPPDKMDAVASLCALAGVNWVRDRLNWAEMEPKKGRFSSPNRYDASATAQTRAGLRVLQVIHASPDWANPNRKRFPPDLRDAYRFFREMARRWKDQVPAFEPWNEADITAFGGHTGAEMASLQKAACLGLKAGNPEIIVCQNVFAHHKQPILEDLHDNAAWPYFDTFNLHHYQPFDNYPKLYGDFRAVSAGRPLWVSECSLPVKWAGDDKLKEPTEADLKVQSERVAKTYACSLHEGSRATFYFLLPHYVEGQTQFGILCPDLTPRPAFIALAAVGRFLADAHPLGRLQTSNQTIRAFLFRARPDGEERDVLVAWTSEGETVAPLPVPALTLFDHLGRPAPLTRELKPSSAPIYAILPAGSDKRLQLTAPPPPPPRLEGKPATVVLQSLWPADQLDLNQSAYRIPPDKEIRVPIFAYNFDDQPVQGRLSVRAAEGWTAELDTNVTIDPMGRQELNLVVRPPPKPGSTPAKFCVAGDFGPATQPILCFRLGAETSQK